MPRLETVFSVLIFQITFAIWVWSAISTCGAKNAAQYQFDAVNATFAPTIFLARPFLKIHYEGHTSSTEHTVQYIAHIHIL